MSVKVTVRDVRCVAGAQEIIVDKVTLLAGNNASGKSTFAMSLAAALTGSVSVVDGMKRNEDLFVVRDGQREGSIVVAGATGSASLLLPAGKWQTKGNPACSSRIAVGGVALSQINKPSDRVSLMSEYIGLEPSEHEIREEMSLQGLDTFACHLYAGIKTNGWDAMFDQAKKKGAELKAQWKYVTGGQSYGKDKALSWKPEGWTHDLESCPSISLLKEKVNTAREKLEQLIGTRSVAAKMREDAAKVKSLSVIDIAPLERAIEVAEEEWKLAVAARRELPTHIPDANCKCPHCGEPVLAQKMHGEGDFCLFKVEVLSKKESLSRLDAISSASGKESNLKSKLLAAKDARRAAVENNRNIEKLSEVKSDLKTVESVAESDVQAARDHLSSAETIMASFSAKKEADALAEKIAINQKVIDMLSPAGMRMRCVENSVAVTNKQLAELSKIAGWSEVSIANDLTVMLGQRQYACLSESEQYRADVILQVWMAARDRSNVMVMDRADVLDKPGRIGLLGLVKSVGLNTLICMTITNKYLVPPPDLKKAGYGRTFWVENGVVTPFTSQTQLQEE